MLKTIQLDDANSAVVIVDQTLLPGAVEYISLTDIRQVYEAIFKLRVRGAPAIGIAAAMGLYIHMKQQPSGDFFCEFENGRKYLSGARPTAVNLNWALGEMAAALEKNRARPVGEILVALKQTAERILSDDSRICRAIGRHGAALLKPGMGVLTHCNAGGLAASEYGTALAPVYAAQEAWVDVRVFADETRPLLQGARLTAFELQNAGVDVTLICDNMAAVVMAKGLIDVIFVGCDRVAANGDTANKIGTLMVAILAKHYGIPFYVCAPSSTIDPATATGGHIVIEERDGKEITHEWYKTPLAPENIKTFNPSFDVTPANLIAGFITEKGILQPPFSCKW
ncbi:MAG: S-methyl-5-thioribose-1-phosphate isomerase [Defluviitaleaceae bacterium]|nr:S-methyl-5-thioribose-1-phosphate isomerase [Defluviitaleaceae bacterium]